MDIHVQTVKTIDDLREVQSFTHDRYVAMGYCEPQPNGRLEHHAHLDLTQDGKLNQNTEVIYVRDRVGTIIGTCSITLDSDDGLHTDLTFPRETDTVRDECRLNYWKLAGCWRIVTATHQPRFIVGSLIDSMVEAAHRHDFHVVLNTFNPHHARFYSRFLGMHVVAMAETEVGLQNAPVVLMRWDWRDIEEWSTLGKHMLPENPQV